MTATLEDRVASGIKLLDLTTPGWEQEIELDELDLAECNRCILGQVFGSYSGGRRTLHLLESSFGAARDILAPEMLGFEGTFTDDLGRNYDELQAEWVRQLAPRLAAP